MWNRYYLLTAFLTSLVIILISAFIQADILAMVHNVKDMYNNGPIGRTSILLLTSFKMFIDYGISEDFVVPSFKNTEESKTRQRDLEREVERVERQITAARRARERYLMDKY